jgi:hypothetical protein
MDESDTGRDESRRNTDEGITMNPLHQNALHVGRREFFGRSAAGLGTAALA